MEYKTELDKLRHSCAHVMAQAVKELWPETKVTIGPAIENLNATVLDIIELMTDEAERYQK